MGNAVKGVCAPGGEALAARRPGQFGLSWRCQRSLTDRFRDAARADSRTRVEANLRTSRLPATARTVTLVILIREILSTRTKRCAACGGRHFSRLYPKSEEVVGYCEAELCRNRRGRTRTEIAAGAPEWE